MNKYGLKLLYRYEIPDANEVLYEMSIIVLEANDFDQAYKKAYAHAAECIDDEHINFRGQKVNETLVDVLDCFELFDSTGEEVQEVYSSFFKNRTDLPEEEYLKVFSDSCSREEMIPIRYYNDSDYPDK